MQLPFDDAPPVQSPPARPWSVSELTSRLKSLVEGAFDRVLVEGEISNCRL
jgi:exonuclease VII large subunit